MIPRRVEIILDLCGLGGAILAGYGLWQISPPCTFIYAGGVLILIAYLGARRWA